ncbi:tRNA (guanine-N(1)-)-methyltransferase [Corynebacterium occultum]|uniref:tRNA (guanine-N(1)-)-methyltransferase n=1 Tax=Corynebacterium occultum TaxID=2675219 RepID=A0A6B8W722_9CORY|nr:tRNA (guanosine(37)-N1)-methyltransferase TrmD [Corynebacterium occultum]QGU07717.1 tRNA (guanine-N(1)-)-methyltransferase [Corynebacterium occultum]
MRLDVLTIFPEYLEPLRHALLGKAIEEGKLSVGVHDLRQWATDVHRSVDNAPYGGGPGMVMKPGVWGPALDDAAAGTGPVAAAVTLESSAPHLDKPRHDDLEGVAKQAYSAGDTAGENPDLPLLIVPTPAGKPFTQSDAQAWSNEEHIVFACGRYEGIDQRVIDDAANRYRVREVSIGDYVLIGGEVAVLVIAEAVVRLIPGVLGNQRSHEEDSFSDGLLEAPSYTKPREWRGLEVPEVLFSGNHAAIEQWRRTQSLLRTQTARPELLERAELTKWDRQQLAMREVSTDLNILIAPVEWERVVARMPKKLRRAGFEATEIHAQVVDLTCEPDNMLVTQFEQNEGHVPVVEVLHRVVVNGNSHLDLKELTQVVVRSLPQGAYWYGTSMEGSAEPGVSASCAWQDPSAN